MDESLTTLNFATSLKHVKVEARAATFVDKDALISGLQTEVQALRDRLSSEGVAAVEELKSELEVANGMLQKYRDSWQEKIEENEKLREQRNSALRKLGVARFRMAARSPRSLSPKDGLGHSQIHGSRAKALTIALTCGKRIVHIWQVIPMILKSMAASFSPSQKRVSSTAWATNPIVTSFYRAELESPRGPALCGWTREGSLFAQCV